MGKFVKNPVIVDAVQYMGGNKSQIIDFTEGQARTNTCHSFMTIPTLEGDYRAEVGDWIIKGMKGEFYPCKPDIFEMTYEPVVEKPAAGADKEVT